MYAGDAERPVLQCEEFTHGSPAADVAVAPAASRGTDLCETCKKRMTCTVEAPDGGVWACPEYA